MVGLLLLAFNLGLLRLSRKVDFYLARLLVSFKTAVLRSPAGINLNLALCLVTADVLSSLLL